jgi:hypothetical protein
VDAGLLLTIPDAGRYLVSEGRTIRVEPLSGIDARNIRLFLLGSAFGLLLHQRGLLPLHANAVEIEGRAVVFMGASGAGKSTMAAWFHDNGYKVLADDVCVVRFDEEGRALACPGLPRLRLWPDAILFTGRKAADFNRSYVGAVDEEFEKFDVPIRVAESSGAQMPLAAIYLLERGDEFAIEQLSGMSAAEPIFANTYRGSYLPAAGSQSAHWHSASRLAQTTPVFRAEREWSLDRLADQCESLIAHAKGVIG